MTIATEMEFFCIVILSGKINITMLGKILGDEMGSDTSVPGRAATDIIHSPGTNIKKRKSSPLKKIEEPSELSQILSIEACKHLMIASPDKRIKWNAQKRLCILAGIPFETDETDDVSEI